VTNIKSPLPRLATRPVGCVTRASYAASGPVCSFLMAIILVFSSALLTFAQQAPFVESAKNVTLTPQQNNVLAAIKSTPSTESVQLIRVNPAILKYSDQISIPTDFGHYVSIKNSSREFRGDNLVSWMGTAPQRVKGSTAMVVNGDNITASIQTTEGLYRIQPLGNGLHTLTKVDTGHLPPEHPPSSKKKEE
jgi:hypothetical protein